MDAGGAWAEWRCVEKQQYADVRSLSRKIDHRDDQEDPASTVVSQARLAGLADGLPRAPQNIGFPKLVNDLFDVVPFRRHGSDFLRWLFTTFDLDPLFQARSKG